MLKKLLTTTATVAVLGLAGTATAATAAPAAPHDATSVASSHRVTSGQANAVREAKSYLQVSAFSRSGLIEQLKYEGFSTKDATYGVDHIKVSWKNQAYKSAQAYLKISGFSYSSLVDQLEYEGFTSAQAQFGAKKALR